MSLEEQARRLNSSSTVSPAQQAPAGNFVEGEASCRQGDVSYVPEMRSQLVAARTVAEALGDLATSPDSEWAGTSAAAPIPEIAGPGSRTLSTWRYFSSPDAVIR
jgi:hypothetical protein